MPQFERGLYEPGEDVRAFDGSEEEDDGEGSRLSLLIVLALVVLAMFAGFVWLAYSEGVARGRSEIPVVTAESGPARVAPANPGGATAPYKGFKIYEQPAPPDEETAQDASPRLPAPSAEAPPKPRSPTKIEASKPATPPVKTAESGAAPMPVAKTPSPELKAVPAPSTPSAPLAAATAGPKQLTSVTALVPAPVQAPASSASGAFALQIGAYKSQAEADAAWNAYKAKHGALLAGYSPNVVQVDLGDKGVWYRLRIAGISGKDVASALCDRLKTDGGSCFLGK
ncbi:MAG TPA: SPOR domain-containing protein [Rhizomicrobium sp.]|nr:SPOR domain-containing protein [Rhizomicrobium sp.]